MVKCIRNVHLNVPDHVKHFIQSCLTPACKIVFLAVNVQLGSLFRTENVSQLKNASVNLTRNRTRLTKQSKMDVIYGKYFTYYQSCQYNGIICVNIVYWSRSCLKIHHKWQIVLIYEYMYYFLLINSPVPPNKVVRRCCQFLLKKKLFLITLQFSSNGEIFVNYTCINRISVYSEHKLGAKEVRSDNFQCGIFFCSFSIYHTCFVTYITTNNSTNLFQISQYVLRQLQSD